MPLSIRALSMLVLAGVLFALLFTRSSAEPPEPAVPDAFREASEGKFRPGGTGDPIADELLKVMSERPIAERLNVEWAAEVHDSAHEISAKQDFSGNQDFSGKLGADDKMKFMAQASRRAVAAEQMLRAARLLERLGESDSDRVALIQQIRSEARRLLSE